MKCFCTVGVTLEARAADQDLQRVQCCCTGLRGWSSGQDSSESIFRYPKRNNMEKLYLSVVI